MPESKYSLSLTIPRNYSMSHRKMTRKNGYVPAQAEFGQRAGSGSDSMAYTLRYTGVFSLTVHVVARHIGNG